MSTPTYNDKDVKRILKINGFIFQRQRGSHRIYKNDKNEHLTVRCNNQNKMIMQRLIKEYNLKVS